MKLLYFAWLRAKIGIAEETIEPPAEVATVGALLEWLKRRGPGFADALKDAAVVRVAPAPTAPSINARSRRPNR